MTARLLTVPALVVIFGGSVRGENSLKSGPPVGASNNRSGFKPLLVAGPATGKNLCPV